MHSPSQERYLRQEMLERYAGKTADFSQLKLGVIGVGGIGGLCSLLLANAGVGFLRIADHDTVALHNLHRQLLFTTAQVGKSKALCAAEQIAERAEGTIEPFARKVDVQSFADFAQGLDLILDVSDDAASRLVISRLCLERQLPLISGAVSGYTALLAIFDYADAAFVEQHGCYQCVTGGAQINTKVGITGPQAASAASLVAHLTLEFLAGNRSCVGKLLRLDLAGFAIQKMGLTRDPQCPVCAGHQG